MRSIISENLIHIVILDIGGVYTQIYDEWYFTFTELEKIKKDYSDINKFKIITI